MSFVEEFEEKMNEIKRVHNEKVAEITDKIKVATYSKQQVEKEVNLHKSCGEVEEMLKVMEDRKKIDAYDEIIKMYQGELAEIQTEVLISSSMYEKYVQEIRETFGTQVAEVYKKALDALNEARAALYEAYQINANAHLCRDMLVSVVCATRCNKENYDTDPFHYEFNLSDYIREPLGFYPYGKNKKTLADCCHDNDLFRQLKLQIEKYSKYSK